MVNEGENDVGTSHEGSAEPGTSAHGASHSTDPSLKNRLLKAFMDLLGRERYTDVSMSMIAENAGVSVEHARACFPNRKSLTFACLAHADSEAFGRLDQALHGASARERLFDAIMSRLEVLSTKKTQVRNIVEAASSHLGMIACMQRADADASRRLLNRLNLETTGPIGRMRITGLSYIFFVALRHWVNDSDPEMNATMRFVDSKLRNGEHLLRLACAVCTPLSRMTGRSI